VRGGDADRPHRAFGERFEESRQGQKEDHPEIGPEEDRVAQRRGDAGRVDVDPGDRVETEALREGVDGDRQAAQDHRGDQPAATVRRAEHVHHGEEDDDVGQRREQPVLAEDRAAEGEPRVD
jgi:hypothetical protein